MENDAGVILAHINFTFQIHNLFISFQLLLETIFSNISETCLASKQKLKKNKNTQ